MASATSSAPASLQLGSGSSAALGAFLVGPSGLTLYTLSSDTASGSVCTGGCLANWPALVVAPGGSVSGPASATGTFATITRADTGATQVTYNGRPLYYFAHDTAAGTDQRPGHHGLRRRVGRRGRSSGRGQRQSFGDEHRQRPAHQHRPRGVR